MRFVSEVKQSTVTSLMPICQCSNGFICRKYCFIWRETNAPPNVITISGRSSFFSMSVSSFKVRSIEEMNLLFCRFENNKN